LKLSWSHDASDSRPSPKPAEIPCDDKRIGEEAIEPAYADAIARDEAAKTVTQLVSGSLVTFSAGFDVTYLITGFESKTCTVRVENLPINATEHDINRFILLYHKGDDDQTCPICYDSISSPYRLGCGHAYCDACLRHFVSSAVNSSDQLPLTCLGDEARCRVPIPISVVQQFLTPELFNRLLKAAFDAYITKHAEEFKHCKTPDCTQIYRAAVGQADGAPQTLHCPSCSTAVCNGCHEDAHEGVSCVDSRARRDATAEQERFIDAWIAEQGGRVKKCPQCSVPIEKLGGCNRMSCRCGAHICWRCMGIFSGDTIYPHMQAVHGTYYDDGNAH